MKLHQLFANTQPQAKTAAGPLEMVIRLLIGMENLKQCFFGNSNSGILHLHLGHRPHSYSANGDKACIRKFHRIMQ
ncbi:hypothetical protein D3C86_1967880 [compost metagenome]